MRVNFRVFTSDFMDCQHFTLDNESQQEAQLVNAFVLSLKEQFPNNQFKVIRVGKKRYNVIPQPQASA